MSGTRFKGAWAFLFAAVGCLAILGAGPAVAQSAGDGANDALQDTLENASPDTAIALALRAIDEGRFEQAVGVLTGLLLGDPGNASLKLLVGDLYSRMASFAQARVYVEDALASGRLSAEEEQNARTILAIISGGAPPPDAFSFSGRISSGFRYRSNATGGTTSDAILVNDQIVVANVNALKEEDTDWFLSASARAVYALDSDAGLNLDVRGFAQVRRQFSETQNDLIVGELTPGLSVLLIDRDGFSLQARPFGILGFADLDGSFAQLTYGGGGELREQLGNDWLFNQSLEFREVDYRAIPGRETLTELDGGEIRFTIGATRPITSSLVANVSYRLTDRDTVTVDQDREQHRFNSGLTYSYKTPFGLSGKSSKLRGNISYTRTNFENPDRAISAITERADREWRAGVSNNLAISDNMTVDVSLSRSERSSSLPNYDSDNTAVSLGFSVNF